MAVYDGLPSIRLEGDKSKALALIPRAKALLGRVQSITRNAGVSTYALTQRIDDDSYIHALQYEGGAVLFISAAPDVLYEETFEEIPVEGRTWPDFYSGMVGDGVLQLRTNPDGQSFSILTDFTHTGESAKYFKLPASGSSARLSVRPYSGFSELKSGGVLDYSQYVKLKPSMYSGAMAKCVQVVMGLGKVPKSKLDGLPKAYVNGIKSDGVQVRYDYKFARTHLIYLGKDWLDRPFPWLIEISTTRGVLAMPLPRFPRTDSALWLAALSARGYDEAPKEVHALFGGLPTGESFPTNSNTLQAKIAKGEIIQLLTVEEMAPFFALSGYSSSCGWTTNANGTEAHNTGYKLEDNGVQKGYHYRIDFNIGPVLPPADRLPNQPIVGVHTAKLTKVSEGWIAYGSANARVPFKIWEPLLPPPGGLLSHDGRAITTGLTSSKNCDTTMFVAHVNGQFKLVKFYRNLNTNYTVKTDSTLPPGQCALGSSWTETDERGVRSFPVCMYTTDVDDRHTPAVDSTISQHAISKKGYGPPMFQDLLEAPAWCTVFRTMYYMHEIRTSRKTGELYSTIVAVPAFHRNAYYHSYGEYFSTNYETTSKIYDGLRDPNSYWGWRKFPSGPGSSVPGHCHMTACGGEHPNRKIICHVYNPFFCSEFSDSGEWAGQCQDVEPMCNAPQPTYKDSSVTTNRALTSGRLSLVADGIPAIVSLPSDYDNHTKWMVPSPDPQTGMIQTIYAEANMFGRTAYVYNTNMVDFGGQIVASGTDEYASFVTFVGVLP